MAHGIRRKIINGEKSARNEKKKSKWHQSNISITWQQISGKSENQWQHQHQRNGIMAKKSWRRQ
jgi:hypothetical protein